MFKIILRHTASLQLAWNTWNLAWRKKLSLFLLLVFGIPTHNCLIWFLWLCSKATLNGGSRQQRKMADHMDRIGGGSREEERE